MPRKEKSPKKKTKEKSPKKRDLEDPAMDEADINRYVKNALDQVNAQHEKRLIGPEQSILSRHTTIALLIVSVVLLTQSCGKDAGIHAVSRSTDAAF